MESSSGGVALEEITWRSPQHVQMMGGFIHSNNVLFYFAESPFFDATSNNATLTLQAMHNDNLRPFIETREAFEGRLKSMQGLEFIVSHDPIQEAAAAVAKSGGMPSEPSSVWVIKKQNRNTPGAQGDVQILAIYYIVGDSIYMAPSLLSVVGRRMLSSVTSLSKIFPTASKQLLFTPSHGHTYTTPVPKHVEGSQSFGSQSTQQTKEAVLMPGSQSIPVPSSTSQSSYSNVQDMRNLSEALNLLSRHGDEYMDEVSLVGEPGSFIFSKNTSSAPATTTSGLAVPEQDAADGRQPSIKSTTGTPAARSAGPDTPGVGMSSFTSVPGSQGRAEGSVGEGVVQTETKDKGKKRALS